MNLQMKMGPGASRQAPIYSMSLFNRPTTTTRDHDSAFYDSGDDGKR